MFIKFNILKIYRRIFKLFPKEFKRKSGLLLIGIFFSSLLDLMGIFALLPGIIAILKKDFIHQNKYLNKLFHLLNFESDITFITFLLSLAFFFLVLKQIYLIWIQRKKSAFNWSLHEVLSTEVLKKMYERGYLFFTENNSNKLLNKIVGTPNRFTQILTFSAFQLLNDMILMLMILLSLVFYNYAMVLLLVGILLPVYFIYLKTQQKTIKSFGKQLLSLEADVNKPVFEIVFGYLDVAVNGVFDEFAKKYTYNLRRAKKIRINMSVIQKMTPLLVETCIALAIIVLLLYGLFQLKDTEATITLVSVYGVVAFKIIPTTNRIIHSIINIKAQEFSVTLIEDFLKPDISHINNQDMKFKNELSVQNVSFRYPQSTLDTLKNFSLNVKKGESVGIIGSSGAGKSTLMNLMLGFLSPTSGSVQVDGTAIGNHNKSAWLRHCGYVSQNVFLIDGNVVENIAFGIPPEEVDVEKLNQVIQQAQLKEFIEHLPEKGLTNIGERGAKISGGQRQRVGIARALYHDAEILFFDEATSNLDKATEHEVTESIRKLSAEAQLTLIIIAHRETTLEHCSRVVKITPNS